MLLLFCRCPSNKIFHFQFAVSHFGTFVTRRCHSRKKTWKVNISNQANKMNLEDHRILSTCTCTSGISEEVFHAPATPEVILNEVHNLDIS